MLMKCEKNELTASQKNIWMMDKYLINSKINNICGIININNSFDIDRVKACINKVLEQNDALRINLLEENGEVFQIFKPFIKEDIKCELLNTYDKGLVKKIISDFSDDIINIYDNKLFRFKVINIDNKSGIILVNLHHIVSDAWSFSKIAEQFISLYEDENKESDMLNNISFLEYSKQENTYLDSEKFLKDEEFFKNYLSNLKEPVSFKEDDGKNDSGRYNASRFQVKLSKQENDNILNFCKDNRLSPYILFLTALSTYMYRALDKSDFVLGTPVLNRANFKEKQIVGMFVSTLPLRVKIQENMKVLELAKNISSDTFELFRHQKYPYLKTLEYAYKNTDTKSNLYNIVLSYQNARIDTKENKYSTSWEFSKIQQDELQIHIVDMDNTGKLCINYDYLDSHFEQIEIKYMHKRLLAIIENLIYNTEVSIEDIKIMPEEEESIIFNKLNNTDKKYENKTPIEMFLNSVKKYENKTALIFQDKKYTYKELDEISNKLANYLISKNVKSGDKLGLMLDRNEQVIISMIACLKLGVAYIPVDNRYPEDRIKYILENSKCKYVVSNNDRKIDFGTINIIEDFEEILNKFSSSKIEYKQSLKDVCYLIYTSGSTGLPKGVVISNQNLSNFLYGINEELRLKESDNLVSITTMSFDIFGLEVYSSICNGLTIVLANDDECVNYDKLYHLCIKNKVTVFQSTPTKIRMLINQSDNCSLFNQFKKIIIGGECLDNNLFKKIKKISNCKLYDVFGPTETTIWSTIGDITNCKNVSAGKPISNTKIWILDRKQRVLPLMIKGELAISGTSVSNGYFENQEKTEKSFVDVNFIKDKVYLTGDLAKINKDLNINILNRLDYQIKINGQRVEIEEIESLILNNKKISDTAISLRENKYLVCFYTLKDNKEIIDKEKVEKDIISYLENKLPNYMVPKKFVFLEDFPYTLNHKKDRKVINKIEVGFLGVRKDEIKIMPRNKIEKIVYSVITNIIKSKDIGVNTLLTNIGIDSLDGIKIELELLKNNIKLSYTDLLRCGTIEKISTFISSKNMFIENKNYEDANQRYASILNRECVVKNNINNKNIILTGATGFLGIHILKELLEKENQTIYCIIRKKDEILPKQRLISYLNYYFDGMYIDQIEKRIQILDVDILSNKFSEILEEKVQGVGKFIHAAACVKHYGDEKYFEDINVMSTKNVCEYCFKNNVSLIHTSTLSISGNGFDIGINNTNVKNKVFDEKSLYIGQNLNNIYARTKFEAECIVFDYIKRGMKANVLRYGNLTNRKFDLRFQKNLSENAFIERIKTLMYLKVLPENLKNIYLEFTPIDLAAEVTVDILNNNSWNNIFHIYDNNHIQISDLINVLNSKFKYEIKFVSNSKFKEKIKNEINKTKSLVSKILIQDVDENYNVNYKSTIQVECKETIKYLKGIGFEWPKIEKEYLIKYIEYFIKIGYIK